MSATGKNKAFTMVEMVVVVVMIGVLAGMIIPRMAGSTSGRRLREEARGLYVAAQYARNRAVNHRRAVRLMFNAEKGTYALLEQSDPTGRPSQ